MDTSSMCAPSRSSSFSHPVTSRLCTDSIDDEYNEITEQTATAREDKVTDTSNLNLENAWPLGENTVIISPRSGRARLMIGSSRTDDEKKYTGVFGLPGERVEGRQYTVEESEQFTDGGCASRNQEYGTSLDLSELDASVIESARTETENFDSTQSESLNSPRFALGEERGPPSRSGSLRTAKSLPRRIDSRKIEEAKKQAQIPRRPSRRFFSFASFNPSPRTLTSLLLHCLPLYSH